MAIYAYYLQVKHYIMTRENFLCLVSPELQIKDKTTNYIT